MAQTLGRYALLDRLGSGGMGEVFAARDTHTDGLVALKVLLPRLAADDESREQFRREARAAGKIQHSGIARVIELGEVKNDDEAPTLYITMELVTGEDLLRRYSTAPPDGPELLDLAIQLASALEAAHDCGVIHRDLKPSNIKASPGGRAKILDFGLAKIQGDSGQGDAGTTARGHTVGTTPYVAPELFEGGPANPSSDLYALGVPLYQISTGRLPFSGASVIDYIHEVATRSPGPMSEAGAELPEDLEGVITRLLSRDLHLRYRSASELLADLHRCTTGGRSDPTEAPTMATPMGFAPLSSRRPSGRWILLVLLGLGVVATLLLVAELVKRLS